MWFLFEIQRALTDTWFSNLMCSFTGSLVENHPRAEFGKKEMENAFGSQWARQAGFTQNVFKTPGRRFRKTPGR